MVEAGKQLTEVGDRCDIGGWNAGGESVADHPFAAR
jgi:hypothetical protein